MAVFKCSDIKEIKIGDLVFTSKAEENEKKLKGYQYDSLVYRYIRAREHMAEYEWERDRAHDKAWYFKQANRDIMRFCQILDEIIGERE